MAFFLCASQPFSDHQKSNDKLVASLKNLTKKYIVDVEDELEKSQVELAVSKVSDRICFGLFMRHHTT